MSFFLRTLLIPLLSALIFLLTTTPAIAQEVLGYNADSGILDVTFNQMPPFEEGGEVEPIGTFEFDVSEFDVIDGEPQTPSLLNFSDPVSGDSVELSSMNDFAGQSLQAELNYDISRAWNAGDAPADVVKLGDLEVDFQVGQLTLSQIASLTGLDLSEVSLHEFPFVADLSISELLADVPLLGEWSVQSLEDILDVQGLEALEGVTKAIDRVGGAVDQTFSDLLEHIPEFGELSAREVFGELSIADIPNLEHAQLIDFEGIGNAVVSEIPGLGDLPLGNFPGLEGLAGMVNVFAMHDISFGPDEYHGEDPTPQPVSGGTDGGRQWKAIPCKEGCAHIELSQPGWDGANWMTKAHRVRDGYGFLGELFGEAGAYRLPFGNQFALQVASTNEAEGTADWGIAFRICQRFWFVDLGCTAYFLEVPLPIVTTNEEDMVLTGIRDFRGGVSEPVAAPPGWEDLRPERPPEVEEVIDQFKPPPPPIGSGGPPIKMDEDCLSAILAVTPTSQVDGAAANIPRIIEAANKHGLTKNQIAYVLATVRIETGPYGWAPIEEIGKPCSYDGGCGWHGRGYVQLTHDYNYKFVGQQLGIDLVNNPQLALEPEIAAEILVAGMKNGWYNGDGHGLGYYINDERQDWFQARRTVNVLDKAETVGGWAQDYAQALSQCATLETSRPSGGVASPIGGVSLEEAISYQPSPGQSFTARRPARNGWHAGIDFDSRIGAGEGGVVTSVTDGEITSFISLGENAAGELSVGLRIQSRDSEGRLVEQRYNHLSESAVERALGVPIENAIGMRVAAGQQIGAVGAVDGVSSGAHLDYKVVVDGQFSDPQQFLQAIINGGGTLRTIGINSGVIGQTQVGNMGGILAEDTP